MNGGRRRVAPRRASVASSIGTMLLLLLGSARAFYAPASVAARRVGAGKHGVMGVAAETPRRRVGALRGECLRAACLRGGEVI